MISEGSISAIKSYCLFCRTGTEQSVARTITQDFQELTAIAPIKVLPEKRQGRWVSREQILLPGYVFLYTEQELLPVDLQSKVHHLYTILQYERGVKTLTNNDAEYADWIYRHQGNISPSRVLIAGNTVQVIDGPLLDCQGTVIKLDKHKRRAWVEFTFDNQKRIVSMGAECVSIQ